MLLTEIVKRCVFEQLCGNGASNLQQPLQCSRLETQNRRPCGKLLLVNQAHQQSVKSQRQAQTQKGAKRTSLLCETSSRLSCDMMPISAGNEANLLVLQARHTEAHRDKLRTERRHKRP